MVRGTQGRSSGKWYFEVTVEDNDPQTRLNARSGPGVATASCSLEVFLGWGSTSEWSYGYQRNGYTKATEDGFEKAVRNPSNNSLALHAQNDVFGVAVNFDSGSIWWSKNNIWLKYGGSANPTGSPETDDYPAWAALSSKGVFYPAVSLLNSHSSIRCRFFGSFISADLTYAPPAGYTAWDQTTVAPISYYDQFPRFLTSSALDWLNDDLRFVLLDDGYTFSSSHSEYSDVSDHKAGEAIDDVPLLSRVVQSGGGVSALNAASPRLADWALKPRGAALYINDTVGALDRPLLFYLSFAADAFDQLPTSGKVRLQLPNSGLFLLSSV
jgi:hypothetical protein